MTTKPATTPKCYGTYDDKCEFAVTCKHRFDCLAVVLKAMNPKPKKPKRVDRGFVPPKETVVFEGRVSTIAQGSCEELTITIPCLPPSKNRYTRRHWRVQQERFFKPWGVWFAAQYRQTAQPRLTGPVDVSIEFCFKRKSCDTLNYAGFPPLMDALVACKIIEDDNAKVCRVTILPPVWGKEEGTVIRITSGQPHRLRKGESDDDH